MIKINNKCPFLCDHCYVDNAEIKKLDEQTISELNKLNPIYISLSDYFFKNLSKLSFRISWGIPSCSCPKTK